MLQLTCPVLILELSSSKRVALSLDSSLFYPTNEVLLWVTEIKSNVKQSLIYVAILVAGVVRRRSILTDNFLRSSVLWIIIQNPFISKYGYRAADTGRIAR